MVQPRLDKQDTPERILEGKLAYCPNCGTKKVKESAVFCSYCGTKF